MTLNQKIQLLKIIRDKGNCKDSNCLHCIFFTSVDNQYCTTEEEQALPSKELSNLLYKRALTAVENIPLFSLEDLFEEVL